ncbi:MAG: bifunctional diguanylate cyclase/phosphodiesterase [Oscillospiraceae bacterium]|nr:bifunctional diguanylate cyclase/phosphodiesterase [Oscillospiraceae bacterium]
MPLDFSIKADDTRFAGAEAPDFDSMSTEDVVLCCLHTLTCEKDLDTAFYLFLQAVGVYYHATRAQIFEFNVADKTISNTFEWCAAGISSQLEEFRCLPLADFLEFIDKFSSDGEFYLDLKRLRGQGEAAELRVPYADDCDCMMAAPLLHEGRIAGFISVDNPVRHSGDLSLLRSVSDIVQVELEQRRLLERLEHMSYTDTLTGLRNRNHYDRLMKEYDVRTPASLGIVLANLNGMKRINNTHGTAYGDQIIKKAAQILRENLSGTVFRTGGDEFAVLCEDISREDFERETTAMHSAFAAEREYSAAIGCVWREGVENIPSLLLEASETLNAGKQAYYQSLFAKGEVTSHVGASGELVREIAEGRFMVYYQPQVNIHTGKITGAEALVRKRDASGAPIPPNKFIPLYEREGIIAHVDLFVMAQACAAMRVWLDEGFDLHLSVNFSRVTLLQRGIVDTMHNICEKNGVPPSHITIEVTESISKMDQKQLQELLRSINELGFTVSLDDFGSEYSNLSILSLMDFDEIKFDRSLVDKLEENHKSRVVMENSIKMCHGLKNVSTLAESIETAGQLELLKSYQCDYGQGYFFSKPVPPEEFRRLLETGIDIFE